MRPLEQILADWRERAATARYLRHEREAQLLEQICDEVATAALEYLTWLSESEAMLRSGRSARWLMAQHPEWLRAGHARLEGRRRFYRMLVVPRRADVAGAYAAGRRASGAA